jgi:nitroreductase
MLDTPDASLQRAKLLDVLERRRSVKPFQLGEPGPTADDIQKLLTVATRVPDHGGLEPWRVILVQGSARDALVSQLSAASRTANAQDAKAAEIAVRKVENLFSAPLTCIVVSRTDPTARIPEWEQVLSAGAVCMNLLTAAAALGYGATWLTGWTAYDASARAILGLGPQEKVAGIIPVGAVGEPPPDRPRPSLQKLVTPWEPA